MERVAIVGASGAVGQELCRLLDERGVRVGELRLLGSQRSAGQRVEVAGRAVEVQPLTEAALEQLDVAVFCATAEISRRFAPEAVRRGAFVVDNSSAFRMEPEVPLVVPEVNAEDIGQHGLVANPNCSTILLAVVLWPLHRACAVRRAVVSTYQAASGAGREAMEELEAQTRAVLAGEPAQPRVLPHPIAFNVFSHDSAIGADGYNAEETKLRLETKKIFHDAAVEVTATCVRVPVFRAHCEAVHIEFAGEMPEDRAREILSAAPGVRVVDDRRANHFPMPIEASGRDEVLVGRIRHDPTVAGRRGLCLFLCGDQLRKGAALNAWQIVEWRMQRR